MRVEFILGLRFLHLISYGVFIGSILTIIMCKQLADKRLTREFASGNISLIVAIDKVVTAPAAITLGVSGAVLAIISEAYAATELWILLLAFIWVLGFIVAHFWSVPRLKQLEFSAKKIGSANCEYARLSKEWFWINVLLLSLLGGASLIAVYRPSLAFVRQLFM